MSILRDWLLGNPSFISDYCLNLLTTVDRVAYIGEVTDLKYKQNDLCTNYTLVLLNDRFFPGYFGFAMQKHSPYTSLISEKYCNTFLGHFY